MDVGKRIIELREAKNISTNKLANISGISQSYLREIEMGKKNPTVEVLSYICYGLEISLNTFFSPDTQSISPFLLSALEKMNDSEQRKLAEFILALKD